MIRDRISNETYETLCQATNTRPTAKYPPIRRRSEFRKAGFCITIDGGGLLVFPENATKKAARHLR